MYPRTSGLAAVTAQLYHSTWLTQQSAKTSRNPRSNLPLLRGAGATDTRCISDSVPRICGLSTAVSGEPGRPQGSPLVKDRCCFVASAWPGGHALLLYFLNNK